MERIRMIDIIPLIGLPEPKYGRASYNVPCPCCDDNPKKKHLNIHLEKDVFRCPRCGFAGGVFDLYDHYAGINRKNAREMDFHFGTYLWDPQYKGLDDYVWEHCYHQGK